MCPTKGLLSRRALVHGAASFAALSLLQGCGYAANPDYVLPSDNPLPSPAGPVVQGTLTVTTNTTGVIPPRFMGLSYEKFAMSYSILPPFQPQSHRALPAARRWSSPYRRRLCRPGLMDTEQQGRHTRARSRPPISRRSPAFYRPPVGGAFTASISLPQRLLWPPKKWRMQPGPSVRIFSASRSGTNATNME